MLQTIGHRTRDRFEHNPYFHFHPMHSTFSLIAALALLGMMVWFLLAIH